MRKIVALLLALVMTAGLTGCSFKPFMTAEELYARPQLPTEYRMLEETIGAVKSGLDVEDAAPLSGTNPSAIQLLDLDGDGTEESAAAFFRANAADDPTPLKIYFFRKAGENYTVSYVVEGEGNNIYSIDYADLDGNGRKEAVVSWQLTTQAKVLSVYTLSGGSANEALRLTYNESFSLTDLDGDGVKELLVVQRDDTGESFSRTDYYTVQEGLLTLTASAPLSENSKDVTAVRAGYLAGQTPAFYVTSECDTGLVTDIFTLREGVFTNVTLYPDSRVSQDTLRNYTSVSVTDINQDGVLEIPVALVLPNVNPDSAAVYRVIYWRQFDAAGDAKVVCTTFHNVTDGWYLMLPSQWDGQILVERDDRLNYRGERAVGFYHRTEAGGVEKFLTIYYLTGDNMETRAGIGNRETLMHTGYAVYAAELHPIEWDCGQTMGEVRERFSLITKEWSAG